MKFKNLKNLFLCETAEEITPPTDVTAEQNVEETKDTQQETTVEVKEETVETKVDTEEKDQPNNNSELEELIKKLQAENETLKSEISSKGKEVDEISKVQEELNSLKTTKETIETKVSDYEKALTGIIDAKLSDVPDTIKDLMPKNATLTEQLEWINKAEQGGILKKQIEIGKPMNPASPKEHMDVSKMSTAAQMALAYSSRK